MRHLLTILVILFVTVPSGAKAANLELVYKACQSWKKINFSTEIGGMDPGVCIGATSMIIDLASLNCMYQSELEIEVTPPFVAYGQFNGYTPSQVAQALINYAEKNPNQWRWPAVALGMEIGKDANFTCN